MLKMFACAITLLGLTGAARAGAPLRLADGRPFVAVYYFGHWKWLDREHRLAKEAEFLADWRANTGQPAILTYRTYSDWANRCSEDDARNVARLYAEQAANWGSGLGFYSWNEMGDTHVAPSRPQDIRMPGALTQEQSDRAVALIEGMVRQYLAIVGR